MAESVVSIRVNPTEYRRLRRSLETRANEAHEHGREMREENPDLADALQEEAAELHDLLERI